LSDDSNIQVTFGAQIQGLMDGLTTATAGVKDTTNQMTGSLSGLSESFEHLKAPIMAFSGLLAGGAMFKEMIESTSELGDSLVKTAQKTGVGVENLSALKYAAGMADVPFESLARSLEKLARNMEESITSPTGKAAQAFKALGVSVTDSSGHLKGTDTVLLALAEKFEGMKDGAGKTALAMDVFGRSGAQLIPFLNKGREGIAELEAEAKRLGVTMTGEAAEGMEEYRDNLKRLKAAGEGMSMSIASAIIPALSQLAASFAESAGPGGALATVATVLGAVFRALAAALMAVKLAVEEAWDVLVAFYQTVDQVANGLARAFTALAAKDWSGVKNSFKGVGESIASTWSKTLDRMGEQAAKTRDEMMKVLGLSGPEAGKKEGGPKRDAPKPQDAEAGKAAAKAAQEQAQAVMEAEIAAAKQAFQVKKDLIAQDLAEKKIADETALTIEKAGVMAESAAEIAAVNDRIAKLNKGDVAYAAEFTKLQKEKTTIVAQTEHQLAELTLKGTEQKLAAEAAAAKQTEDLAKESAREQMAAGKDALAAQKATLDQKVSLGQISSAQELAQRKALIQAEEQLNLQAKDAEIAAEKKGGDDPVKLQQLANQKVDIERKAQAQISELDRKAAKDQEANYRQVFQILTSGFSSAIAGLIKGTMSWGQAFKSVLSEALNGMINFFVQMGLKAAENWLMQQLGFETAQQTQLATAIMTNVSEGTSSAALAAVNAFASICAIPIVGPELAPAAAATAYGQGMGWAALASAAGGWDQVPSDQVAQIHKNEMVMSAPLATGIRNMVANGQAGAAGKGAQGGGNTLHVSAMDAKSFGKWLNKSANKRALGGTLGGMFRNGATR
jgi:hypothetical protein